MFNSIISLIPFNTLSFNLQRDCALCLCAADASAQWLRHNFPNAIYNKDDISTMFTSYTNQELLFLYGRVCPAILPKNATELDKVYYVLHYIAEKGHPVIYSITNSGHDVWTVVQHTI